MFEHHKSETPSDGERAQPPMEKEPMSSEGELPAVAEQRETKEASAERTATRTRPEIPVTVSLEDMYVKASDVYTQEQKTKSWSDAAEMVQPYSDETIKRWKEEIDTYLVFAGLFSAVLTTFNVQSYLLLQPSPPDPSIAVLQHISSQLASFSVNPPFVNSTQPPSTGGARTSTPPPVPYWAVWLNTLWFSGLILSLISASIGIMVKQWLNGYSSGVSGTSRPASRMRQYRLNNLRSWHVEDVIVTIPILLQLALALFLAGLLILLWTLDDTVAAVASTLVGILAVFTFITILLPLFNHKCSYITPQIRAVNAIWQPKRFAYWVCSSMSAWCHTISEFLDRTQVASHHSLSSFDPRLHRYLTRLVLWGTIPSLKSVFRRLEHAIKTPKVWAEHKQTWQGRERSAIDKLARGLDTQTLLEAYNSTLHPDALSAATVCLMDYRSEFVIDYFRQLHTAAREHFGAAADSEDGPLGYGNRQQLLWLYIVLCVLRQDDIPLSDDEAAALRVYFRCGSWSSGMQAADAGWAVPTCNAIFDDLETSGASSKVHVIHKDDIQMEWELLIEAALRRKVSLPDALYVPPAVSTLYCRIRLNQSHITEAPSDEAQEVHTRYLESVDDFLRCADRVLTSPLPAGALETVRAYSQDALVELTRTLLGLFAEDKARTTIESTRLWSIMWGLSRLDDARVEECVPEDVMQDVVRLAEILETASEYVDSTWVPEIQEHAGTFKANVVRVKNKPGGTTSLQTPHTALSGTDAPASSGPEVSSVHCVAENASVSPRDPKDNSQDTRAASFGGPLS